MSRPLESDNDARTDSSVRSGHPQLSVVVPTYNEAENITVLIDALEAALGGVDHEIIVVDDDSPDRTWERARQHGLTLHNPLHVIRRTEDRGLSSAVLTGMRAARGDVLAVIDADLQHDERVLPLMVDEIVAGADICVGSRKVEGGGYGDWSRRRRLVSWTATVLAQRVLKTVASDPMSGFFAVSREAFIEAESSINPRGFKILLEFLARSRPGAKVAEVGYVFRNRERGQTKMSGGVIGQYLLALLDLRLGRVVSSRFVKYALVGTSGIVVNLLGYVVAALFGVGSAAAVLVGVEASILWNFAMNNRFTYRTQRYDSSYLLKGALFYQVVSMHGLFVQLCVFLTLDRWDGLHFLGPGSSFAANTIAIAFAAVGNYFLHSNYTWSRLAGRRQ